MAVLDDDIDAVAARRPVPRARMRPHVPFRCILTALPSPAGDIDVLRVVGDVDLTSVALLETTLEGALSVRQDTLVVDLSGVPFCSARGLDVLIDFATVAADVGVRCVISGASDQAHRVWTRLWPADQLPDRFPTVRIAVLDAMTRRPGGPPVRAPLQLVPAPRPAPRTDEQLGELARAGDTRAYRTLVRRHHARMYRSALGMLGASDDPADVADDIAARLHAALAAFTQAGPR